MGDSGARRIRERFSWRRTAEGTLALYEEVLSRGENERLSEDARIPQPHPVP